MRMMLYTLLCAVGAVALLMLGLGVKMLFDRRAEFKRHCSSMDPYTGERGVCVCGRAAGARCEREGRYQPLEVNDELMEEVFCIEN
ncbi:MAG: hypothetical protein IJK84_03285 [Bacteroidales bacterium]|nr:hypothetical protein [Bacteroidales bacterium]